MQRFWSYQEYCGLLWDKILRQICSIMPVAALSLPMQQVSKVAHHWGTGNAGCAGHLPCGAFLVLQDQVQVIGWHSQQLVHDGLW